MKKQYHEIMDNLVVTEEMRARILEHLTDCDLQETSEKHPIRRFPVWGRYLSIAASPSCCQQPVSCLGYPLLPSRMYRKALLPSMVLPKFLPLRSFLQPLVSPWQK